MHVRVFLVIFFMVLLFRSSHDILPKYKPIQTLLSLFFRSKDSVSKHNILDEHEKLPAGGFYRPNYDDFYHGNINDDVDDKVYKDNASTCRGSCLDGSDDWSLFAYIGQVLQEVFELCFTVLLIAPFLYLAIVYEKQRQRQCCSKWKTIGKLRVSSTEIAKGSNGTVVFEGIYDGRKVAVKRLVKAHHDVASTEVHNLIDSDQHPNIVRWYGCEYDHDFVYLSFERCDCSLYDLIQKKLYSESFQLWRPNGYPSPVLLKLMRDMVVGLVHLHDLGIIHRDLKPHNVLIVKRKGLCPKLSDMGISRRLAGDMTSLGDHATGSGSSGWQAPEQLGLGRQTLAMDLFSLGCILFFCMTRGRHPFGDHLERNINVTKNKVNIFLVKHIAEAVDLLSRLLNFEPKLRPKASEVLHHPLFWNSERRMSFLRDTSDRVALGGRRVAAIVTALESEGCVAFCGKWDVKMEPAFISSIVRHRDYNYESVRDLLRAIRNIMNHYREFPKKIQELLGSVPEGLDDYFRSKFPKLLMEVYNVMYHHCKQEDWFRKYLEN